MKRMVLLLLVLTSGCQDVTAGRTFACASDSDCLGGFRCMDDGVAARCVEAGLTAADATSDVQAVQNVSGTWFLTVTGQKTCDLEWKDTPLIVSQDGANVTSSAFDADLSGPVTGVNTFTLTGSSSYTVIGCNVDVTYQFQCTIQEDGSLTGSISQDTDVRDDPGCPVPGAQCQGLASFTGEKP